MDVSALDEMLDNERSLWDGTTLKHLSGSSSRMRRVLEATAELAALRALVEKADAVMESIAGVECRRASCASDGEDYVDERGHEAVHKAKRAYLAARKDVTP